MCLSISKMTNVKRFCVVKIHCILHVFAIFFFLFLFERIGVLSWLCLRAIYFGRVWQIIPCLFSQKTCTKNIQHFKKLVQNIRHLYICIRGDLYIYLLFQVITWPDTIKLELDFVAGQAKKTQTHNKEHTHPRWWQIKWINK